MSVLVLCTAMPMLKLVEPQAILLLVHMKCCRGMRWRQLEVQEKVKLGFDVLNK